MEPNQYRVRTFIEKFISKYFYMFPADDLLNSLYESYDTMKYFWHEFAHMYTSTYWQNIVLSPKPYKKLSMQLVSGNNVLKIESR